MQIDKQMEEIFEGARQIMGDYEEILDILKQLHEEEEDTFMVYTSEQDTEDNSNLLMILKGGKIMDKLDVYVGEMHVDGKIKHVAIEKKLIDKEDITKSGVLSKRGMKKFKLSHTVEFVGVGTLIVERGQDIAKDTNGIYQWKYMPEMRVWLETF